jgi:hypothetical protein
MMKTLFLVYLNKIKIISHLSFPDYLEVLLKQTVERKGGKYKVMKHTYSSCLLSEGRANFIDCSSALSFSPVLSMFKPKNSLHSELPSIIMPVLVPLQPRLTNKRHGFCAGAVMVSHY